VFFLIAQAPCLQANYEQEFAIKLDVWQQAEAGFFWQRISNGHKKASKAGYDRFQTQLGWIWCPEEDSNLHDVTR
jgi:hypothetical protein